MIDFTYHWMGENSLPKMPHLESLANGSSSAGFGQAAESGEGEARLHAAITNFLPRVLTVKSFLEDHTAPRVTATTEKGLAYVVELIIPAQRSWIEKLLLGQTKTEYQSQYLTSRDVSNVNLNVNYSFNIPLKTPRQYLCCLRHAVFDPLREAGFKKINLYGYEYEDETVTDDSIKSIFEDLIYMNRWKE